jgi:hypothetical protein
MLFFSREMLIQFPGCFHKCNQGHICRYYDGIDIEMPIVFSWISVGEKEHVFAWPCRMELLLSFFLWLKMTFFWFFVDSARHEFKYRKHDVPVLHIETFNSTKKHARMVVKVRISLNMSFIKLCWYIGTCFASALENLRLF